MVGKNERKGVNPMYINAETIILAGAVFGALAGIFGYVRKLAKWLGRQAEQDEELKRLKHQHEEDVKEIREESQLLVYGILSCLKGLQEKGCNGPVTEAIGKFERYLNEKAHDK